MSTEGFLDQVARTLAEPMSRRRAVRVMGVTLVAATLPGMRLGPARAQSQPGVCVKTTCGKDQRCCQKAGAILSTYCCPAPSWQFQCGGQDNGYRCVNVCKGGPTFPCTAVIAHPESGINGVCCDRRLHSGCTRVGPPARKRPDGTKVPSEEWKPSCCPKGVGFGFCGGVCCQPPNRCRDGVCRCPDGKESCDGSTCCASGSKCNRCYVGGTRFGGSPNDVDLVEAGKKCCPKGYAGCCGTTCCKERGCCGEKCCPWPKSVCAASRSKEVCCPRARALVTETGYRCCPSGTVAPPFHSGCCPPNDLECCGKKFGAPVTCGRAQTCVRGTCVSV